MAMASGRDGERAAAAFLEKRGFRIIAQNYSVSGGELDLVAFRRGLLVFVEVKTRSSELFGKPADAVDDEKISHLIHAETIFLREHRKNGRIPVWSPLLKRMLNRRIKQIRNDVAEVYLGSGRCEVHIIENAFEVPQ